MWHRQGAAIVSTLARETPVQGTAMKFLQRLSAIALCAVSVAALAQEQPTYRLTLVLKENSSRAMRFQDLNDQGEIIGNRSNPDFTETASVWRGSSFEPLNPLVSSSNVFAS